MTCFPCAAKGAPAGLVVAEPEMAARGSFPRAVRRWRSATIGTRRPTLSRPRVPWRSPRVTPVAVARMTCETPRLVSWGPGRARSVPAGAGGAVWHRWGTFGAWEGWEFSRRGGCGHTRGRHLGSDCLDLFAVGTDGRLFHKAWDGASWRPNGTGWRPLGGDVIGSPTAVSWAPGRLDVFANHPAGGIRHINGDGESWATWENLGGDVLWSPTAVSWGPSVSTSSSWKRTVASFHKAWTGPDRLPGPTVWRPLGGSVAGTPAAVAWSSGRLDVVAVHPNRSPRHLYGDGTNFSDWESLGGGIVATRPWSRVRPSDSISWPSAWRAPSTTRPGTGPAGSLPRTAGLLKGDRPGRPVRCRIGSRSARGRRRRR